jgi:hypothetical protein
MHRIRLASQHRQNPYAQLKSLTLCHAKQTNTTAHPIWKFSAPTC